ncbi:MAG: hypothetical protein WCK73_18335 [Deltaproteobacteria bacterium]
MVRLCDAVEATPGGQLAVLLPETDLAGALQTASRLLGLLRPGPEEGTAMAVGVASYPGPGITDAEGLLRAAQRAMERGRSAGGGILTPGARH